MSDRIFKGVVVDGVLVMNTHGILPDDSIVEGVAAKEGMLVRATKATRGKVTRRPKGKKAPLYGFGLLKDKPEWKGRTGAEIARELRSNSSRRARRA